MEKVRAEQDFSNIKMLLRGFSDANSSNEPRPTASSSEWRPLNRETAKGMVSPSSAYTGFYHPSEPGKQSNDTSLFKGDTYERPASVDPFEQNLSVGGNFDANRINLRHENQTLAADAREESSNLPDDQSLASAFADLSFEDSETVNPAMDGPLKCRAMSKSEIFVGGQYTNYIKKPHHLSCSIGMAIPTLPGSVNHLNITDPVFETYPSITSTHEPNKFNLEMNGQGTIQLFNNQKGLERLVADLGRQRQSLPLISGAPLYHHSGTHAFPVGPTSFPVQGVEFPISSLRQQLYLDQQTPLCMQPQHLGQAHVAWHQMEDSRYCRTHPHYISQGLPIQVSDPIQASGASPMATMARNWGHPHVGTSYAAQVEVPKWDAHPINERGFNYPDPSTLNGSVGQFPSQGYSGVAEFCSFGNGGKQNYGSDIPSRGLLGSYMMDRGLESYSPEKILIRSHGLNPIKLAKQISIGRPESLHHMDANGRALTNGQFNSSGSARSPNAPFQGQSSSSSSSGNLDFRDSSRPQPHKDTSLDEVQGRIYQLAKDQNGCRFLQRLFAEGTAEDVQKIFVEIIDHVVELMTDPFGNYLVQKLLEKCDEDQRMQIISAATTKKGELIQISRDMHGTRAVQKVIETLKTRDQNCAVVSALKPAIVTLIKDMNGNHVAQRCLQHLMPEYVEFLFDAVAGQCVELAMDRHGCCVLQKCLENSNGELRNHLMSEIASNALVLSENQYGNYVVQFALKQGVLWAATDVINQLKGSYAQLSMQKYSSNVVEKCLIFSEEVQRVEIFQELMRSPDFSRVLQDQFGNYVIQCALSNSQGAIHAALVEAIQPHVPALRSSPYGKKVLSSDSLKHLN